MSESTHTSKEEKEIVSRPNHLKLVKFSAEQYAGLDYTNSPEKSLVLFFPENEHILEAKGDQGVGKTSLMRAFMASMGMQEPDNAINNKTANKSAQLEFEHDDKMYKVRITKTGFGVTYDTEVNGKTVKNTVNKPKEVLQNIIGPIGISPEFLRNQKSGAEQIKWIKSLTLKTPEAEKEEADIQYKHASDYKERTIVNRDEARLKTEIISSGLYQWDSENFVLLETEYKTNLFQKVKDAPEEAEVKEIYTLAQKKRDELVAGRNRIDELQKDKKKIESEISEIDRQIEELTAKKTGKAFTIAETDKAIAKGLQFVEERKDAEKEFDVALENMQNASNIALGKKALDDISGKIVEYKKIELRQEELNNNLELYSTQLKELAKQYTPAIEGLEVVVNGIDNTKLEGVYLNGVNMAHLSESECWDLCLQLWKMQGTSVVFIENITSLGSAAIDRVNWFADQGGYVFVSQMQRGYQELKVEFINQIK